MSWFWRWECWVQDTWLEYVAEVAERYGTDDDTAWRMVLLGWRVLFIVTWPQWCVRRIEAYFHFKRGLGR